MVLRTYQAEPSLNLISTGENDDDDEGDYRYEKIIGAWDRVTNNRASVCNLMLATTFYRLLCVSATFRLLSTALRPEKIAVFPCMFGNKPHEHLGRYSLQF